MSILSVFHDTSPQQPNKVLTHFDDIVATLAEQGIRFVRRPQPIRPRPGSGPDAVLEALREPLDQMLTEYRCGSLELLDCDGSSEQLAWMGEEHAYAVEEVWVQVSGRAQISVRAGDWVYALLCEKEDVLQVPASMGRWVDLGDRPFCVALRLLEGAQPCQATFVEGSSAQEFPGMDEL